MVFLKLFALMSLFFAIGCATGSQFRDIKIGMSKSHVEALLGDADSAETNDNEVVMHYTQRLVSEWAWDRADYFIRIKNDEVTQYGQENIDANYRSNQSRRESISSASAAYSKAMQDSYKNPSKTTSCTSNKIGNMVFTDCE